MMKCKNCEKLREKAESCSRALEDQRIDYEEQIRLLKENEALRFKILEREVKKMLDVPGYCKSYKFPNILYEVLNLIKSKRER